MPTRRSPRHVTLLSGGLSQSLSFCRSHGRIWPRIPSSLSFRLPLKLASRTSTNGIGKQTTLTSTSFVSVSVPAPAPMQLLTFKTLALDPNWKLAYARAKWSKENFDAGVQRLENVVRPFRV